MTNPTTQPAAVPWYLEPTYLAEKTRKQSFRQQFGYGKHSRKRYREHVYKLVAPLNAKGMTHKTIAAKLTADNVPRFKQSQIWHACSIRQLLKDYAKDQLEAATRRDRLAALPKRPLYADMTEDQVTPTINPTVLTSNK